MNNAPRTLLLVLSLLMGWSARAMPTDSLVIRFANRTRLVIYAPDKASIQALRNYDLNKIVGEMAQKLDSIPAGKTTLSRDGEQFVKDTLVVITRQKNGVMIVINGKDTTRTDSARNKRDYKIAKATKKSTRWIRGIDFQLGLNTLLTQTESAAYPTSQYELKPLGSRYFAVALKQQVILADGKRAKFSLYYALEGAWNNYMFDNNNVATRGANGLELTPYSEPLKKTKLTTFALQVPVVPRLTFYNAAGRKTMHIGLGGFVGYRLDSYTKIKRENNDKSRDHNSFYLNNLRYGLVGHIGFQKTSLFVKYDLNPLFQPGKGPDVRALSFGLSI